MIVGFTPMKLTKGVATMAETKRMTAEQVVSYLLEEEGLDFLRESLTWVVQQLMEAEVTERPRRSDRASAPTARPGSSTSAERSTQLRDTALAEAERNRRDLQSANERLQRNNAEQPTGEDLEIVMLAAHDEDDLRRTHSHYFESLDELLQIA
jgi:hypothetical protein